MQKSMTGYGRGEATSDARTFRIEMRSINAKYLDISIKIPRFLIALEDDIRRRLQKTFKRGKIECFVAFESTSAHDGGICINESAADGLMKAMRTLCDRYGEALPGMDICLPLLVRNPDVFSRADAIATDAARAQMWEILSKALDAAAAALDVMRATEGRALCADILSHNAQITACLDEIRSLSPDVAAAQTERLRNKISEITTEMGIVLDEARILTEIAILADKADISEELVRIASHQSQLVDMLAAPGASGRKIDFLLQEMLRETNTIGQKSNESALSRLVIEIKSLVEKIREQVQNIE